ncbi:hypothetical protein DB88DRAFT_118340 [Papiliotrema laurentii]|uniref:Protein CPL1-like domain-containing protein n=1 Tax=Papiliotrema laurentii TaxID=5418 RepID=A0AAD9CT37_PAPLA|nr:hypothetical protein DB88DRAFT_118340 [Papiliotrema laurentii]
MVRILSLLPILTALYAITSVSALGSFDTEFASGGNLTARGQSSGWATHKCANVASSFGSFRFNFGCLCQDDVDDFCRNNNINGYIKGLLNAFINSHGESHQYPPNAQPSCNGGDYDCGSLSRQPDGTCGQTTCEANKLSTNGGCCPRGQTWQNGQCCGKVGCARNGPTCTPVIDCSNGGDKWCKTKCCKSYLEEDDNGNCVCPNASDQDNGSSCGPKCPPSKRYNHGSGQCETACDTAAGYYPQRGWKGTQLCCKQGQTACNTVCCPPGKEEIDDSGVCCNKGSKVSNGQCVEPSGRSHYGRRALAGRFNIDAQVALPVLATQYGLEANKGGELCPETMAACPIPGRANDYECLDTQSDLQSCGGCASLQHGVDCTAIAGARWMGCNEGKCEVYSCKKGWTRAGDGSSCVREG